MPHNSANTALGRGAPRIRLVSPWLYTLAGLLLLYPASARAIHDIVVTDPDTGEEVTKDQPAVFCQGDADPGGAVSPTVKLNVKAIFMGSPPASPSLEWQVNGISSRSPIIRSSVPSGPTSTTEFDLWIDTSDTAEVTFTITAKNTNTGNSATSAPASTVKLTDLDLDIAGVSEANEDEDASLICLNHDDDDSNGKPDKDQTGEDSGVTNEEDLKRLSVSLSASPDKGDVTFSHGSEVKLWKDKNREGGPVSRIDAANLSDVSPLWVEGVKTGEDTSITATYTRCGSKDTVMATVYKVKSVDWKPVDPDMSNISSNSVYPKKKAAIGKRIFPGAKSSQNKQGNIQIANKRNQVKVKVQLKPNIEAKVHLDSFDVDDPSYNKKPVDKNKAKGNDNRNQILSNVDKDGNIKKKTLTTSAREGASETTFKTTMSPGDNFRIAATCDKSRLDQLTVADPNDALFLGAGTSNSIKGFGGSLTTLLTVSRELHIERDSMKAIAKSGNQANGTNVKKVDFLDPDNDGNSELTKVTVGKSRLEQNRFDEGTFVAIKSNANNVSASINDARVGFHGALFTANLSDSFILKRRVSGGSRGDSWKALDDDVNSRSTPLPSVAKLRNSLQKTYVTPVLDLPQGKKSIPTVLNMTPGRLKITARFQWDSASTSRKKFWIAWIISAFQFKIDSDADPDYEQGRGTFGATSPQKGGSAIFRESIHDVNKSVGNVVVHEIGHALTGSRAHSVEKNGGYVEDYVNKIRNVDEPITPINLNSGP